MPIFRTYAEDLYCRTETSLKRLVQPYVERPTLIYEILRKQLKLILQADECLSSVELPSVYNWLSIINFSCNRHEILETEYHAIGSNFSNTHISLCMV